MKTTMDLFSGEILIKYWAICQNQKMSDFLKGEKEEIPKWYGILKTSCADRKRFNSIGYFFFQFGKAM